MSEPARLLMSDAMLLRGIAAQQAQILAEVRASRAEVAELQAAVEQFSRRRENLDPRRVLSDHDQAVLATLLPAVYGALSDRVWSVAVIVTLAATADSLADALAPFLATPGGLRGLGKLLRRADGQPVAGFVVERVGADRTGALWRVSRVSNSQETRTAHCADTRRGAP